MKTDAGDLAEYYAFRENFSQSPTMFQLYHKAFLLQFVGKNVSALPKDAQGIVAKILQSEKGRRNALAFNVIERLDYLIYPLLFYFKTGDHRLLIAVLKRQLPHYERFMNEVPGFKETLWTPECHATFSDFFGRHKKDDAELLLEPDLPLFVYLAEKEAAEQCVST